MHASQSSALGLLIVRAGHSRACMCAHIRIRTAAQHVSHTLATSALCAGYFAVLASSRSPFIVVLRHSAGTFDKSDGSGGTNGATMRFEPEAWLHACRCTYPCPCRCPMHMPMSVPMPVSLHVPLHMSLHMFLHMSTYMSAYTSPHMPARMSVHMSAHMTDYIHVVTHVCAHVSTHD